MTLWNDVSMYCPYASECAPKEKYPVYITLRKLKRIDDFDSQTFAKQHYLSIRLLSALAIKVAGRNFGFFFLLAAALTFHTEVMYGRDEN